MYVNRPNAIPSAQNADTDPAQDAAAAAADVQVSAAASAAASAASSAVAAPLATTSAALGLAASASAAAPTEEYVFPLANDMLGVVAGYLPDNDQLAFRELNRPAKAATDRQMETLSLSTSDAIALFRDTANLPNLTQLTFHNCDAAGLDEFVDVLGHARYSPFELVIKEAQHDALTADVLARLSTLPLSGLTLRPTFVGGFGVSRLSGLEQTEFPVNLDLAFIPYTHDFDVVARLTKLTSLSMGNHVPRPDHAAELASCASLRAFKTEARLIQPEEILPLLTNTHLQTLSVNWISYETDEVKEALTNHPGITTLELGVIQTPELLTAVLRNPIISSLRLTTAALHPSVMHEITDMPSLRTFTLSSRYVQRSETDAESMRALCSKPLQELRFEELNIQEATLAIAAGARAQSLTLENNGATFGEEAITALVANPHVTSLSFSGDIVAGGAAQIAAAPGLKKLSIDIASTVETVDSVRAAWKRAGKPLGDLTVTVRIPAAE